MKLPRMPIAKASGYLLPIAVTAAVGLVSLPVVIAFAGAEAWASLAVAQAVGAVAGTAVSYGWPVVGAARVAALKADDRGRLIALSLWSRLALFIPALALAIAVVAVIAPRGTTLTTLAIACSVPIVQGLSAAWIFVGEGRPADLNRLDLCPRILGTVGGVLTLVLSSNLLLFVLLQLAGQVAGIAVSYHALFRRYRGPRHRIRVQDVVETYRTGFYGLVSSAVTTAYQNSPLLIAAAVIPNVVTVFAMCDRLYRIAQLSLVPVTQIAQGYVPAASSPLELVRRMRVALFASIMCGVVAWVAFAGLARPASLLLSDSQIAVPPAAAVFLGASVAITLLSSVSSRACLVAIGRVGAVAASAVAGAAVAMVGVYVGAVLWGVDGAALGVLAAEAVAFFVLISTLIRGAKQLLSGATEGNHEA